MGIKWQPLREPSDRWGFMGEPLTLPHEALIVVQAVMAEQAAAEEAEPVDNSRLNAMVETIYGPVIEETRRREQNLLDLFEELGIE
jgi:hypothetical protein